MHIQKTQYHLNSYYGSGNYMFHYSWIIMMNYESVTEGIMSNFIHEAQCHPWKQGQLFLLA